MSIIDRLAIAAIFTAVTALPATAQSVTAAPESVVAAMQAKGYQAELAADDSGDPIIRSGTGGDKFTIFFYGCENHTKCTSLQFYAGFTVGSKFSPDKMNQWNSQHRFGRGYIDKVNDPVVEMDLDVDVGGISRALFNDQLEVWSEAVANFREFVFSK